MRIVLILILSLLAGCCLLPGGDAPVASSAEAAPASAEPQEMPQVQIRNTGDELYFYHHVWGDCDFLQHGHGRNNAWGLARLLLGEVRHGGIVSDGHTGFEIRYTCKDGSDCIQTGALDETPNRAGSHTIPFQTTERAEGWLADVATLEKACAARR